MTVAPIDSVLSVGNAATRAVAVPDGAPLDDAPNIGAIPGVAPNIGSIPAAAGAANDPADLFNGLVQAFEQGDQAFARAQSAENDAVAGRGDIQTMVFERARADAILSIASGAASHLTQSLNTVLQMQV